jgi:tetratricopeptide (TPR) repeat protein/tRNA A-37 threonylcarbamoyl transferase component Bud32
MISERAAEIFLEAQTLDADTRAHFVSTACGDDADLVRAVNKLLAASSESEVYFEGLSGKVGLGSLVQDDSPLPQDKVIGSWRLLKRIGRGGMGAVYLAERADEQFEQRAALKILPTGLDSELARARFLVERQILARLTHDNIARLLDGGVTDDGVPYFVMDYVKGVPIDDFCEKNDLGIREKLALVLDIARAVQFAHRNLIVHRDLKPSNVLVDASGRVRLLDFGIAKMLSHDAANMHLTRESRRPATPAFASPEMLLGQPVDATADVYSIGALMYVLLTGRLPLDYSGLDLAEMYKHALEAVPDPMSRYDERLKGDLDAIVGKALAKLPGERYVSVESLANDIRNFLDGLPIAAKPPAALYRARKFLGRHRIGVSFVAFVVVALASIAGLAIRAAIISDRQAQEIKLERDRAEQTKEFLVSIFDSADPNVVPGEQTAMEILDAGKARIELELAEQPAVQADLLAVMGEVYVSWRLTSESHDVRRQELALRELVNGTNSREYADVLAELAIITDIAGDYDASRDYATAALDISTALNDPLGQARGHERVGRVLHLQGEFDAAGMHFRKALDLIAIEKGEDAVETSYVREHLANLLHHQQQYEDALSEFEKTLAVRGRHIIGDSSEMSPIYLGLGSVLIGLGRPDEASEAYETGYAMNERLYGADNSYNLFFANGLGKVAETRGDLQTASARFEEARRLIVKHVPDSPNLAFATANIARLHVLQGDHAGALTHFESAAAIFEEKLPAHWALGDVRWRWGQCLTEIGRYAEAEPLILSGIEIVEEQWGRDHTTTAQARAAAVQLYTAWGKPERVPAYGPETSGYAQ